MSQLIKREPGARQTEAGAARDLSAFGIDDTMHRLLRLTNSLSAPFSMHLEHRFKISFNEFRLLMLIGRNPGCFSHELVTITGVNAMSISRAVSALQKHGRITAERDPGNKRRKSLVLTAEGEHLYQAMRPLTERVATYLVSGLEPWQVQALNAFLDAMTDTLLAKDEEANSMFLEFTRLSPEETGEG